VRSILDRIYEPIFSDQSHGFRVGRSCHTALTHIDKIWQGVKWLVEVDIKGYFDNINHKVLLDLLHKRIDDEKFLTLISDMLKAAVLCSKRPLSLERAALARGSPKLWPI